MNECIIAKNLMQKEDWYTGGFMSLIKSVLYLVENRHHVIYRIVCVGHQC
jgi:hypothetical protein